MLQYMVPESHLNIVKQRIINMSLPSHKQTNKPLEEFKDIVFARQIRSKKEVALYYDWLIEEIGDKLKNLAKALTNKSAKETETNYYNEEEESSRSK